MTQASVSTPHRPLLLNPWWRDGVAWTCSALTIAGIIGLESLPAIEHAKPEKPAIEIQLADIKDLPPDPPPPPKVQPQPPLPPDPAPQPKVAQTVAPTPSPTPAPVAQQVQTPQPVAQPVKQQEVAKPQPARPVSNASADLAYEARVKTLIEGRKSYPTGRQAMIEKPQGTVHVCVTVSRSGSSQGVSIKESSGSNLLDSAAKRLLQSLEYPAFPESVFAGEESHVICTNLEYKSPTS